MLETILTGSFAIASKGLELVLDYWKKREEAKKAQVTLADLNKRLEELNKKFGEVEKKVMDVLKKQK